MTVMRAPEDVGPCRYGHAVDAEQRRCQGCRKLLPLEHYRHPTGRLTARCQRCLAVARTNMRRSRERIGPAGVRAAHLWAKYRITAEQYDALRAAQDYRCKICGIREDDIAVVLSGRPRSDGRPAAEPFPLVVDHCHRRRRVRGLLCNHCNAMIGQARDRPEVLRAGADYLDATAPP